MDKNELERRLEAAEKQNLGLLDEIKNLKAQLAKVQDEPEIPDFPEFMVGDDYYQHIRWESIPRKQTVGWLREGVCKKPLTAEMNYFHFHSAEYYHSFESKCKLIAMMLHCKWYLCYDHHPDFNDGDIQKWTVVFNYDEGKFTVEFSRMREWSTIYFDTEENAQKCADWLNAHKEMMHND